MFKPEKMSFCMREWQAQKRLYRRKCCALQTNRLPINSRILCVYMQQNKYQRHTYTLIIISCYQ